MRKCSPTHSLIFFSDSCLLSQSAPFHCHNERRTFALPPCFGRAIVPLSMYSPPPSTNSMLTSATSSASWISCAKFWPPPRCSLKRAKVRASQMELLPPPFGPWMSHRDAALKSISVNPLSPSSPLRPLRWPRRSEERRVGKEGGL